MVRTGIASIRAMALALVVLLAGSPDCLRAQTVGPGDMLLSMSFEELPENPYVGEMVLLTVKGEYKIPIARETLIQPRLDGFDWMQLGEDDWTEDTTRGRKILQFKRVIALFPNREGPIEVDPFVHQLELWTTDGRRFPFEIASDPIELTAAPQPQVDGWWLPARRITVSDNWSNPPDKLGEGEGALRVISVTVEGVRPEQIPAMPELGSAGAYVFAHPERRIKRLYETGPVTRTFWRWTVRPEHPPSAYLKPIEIRYFDTRAREHKVIEISAQRIAMTEEAVARFLAEADEESLEAIETSYGIGRPAILRYAGFAAPLALGAGLLGGLAILLPGLRLRGRRRLAPILAALAPDPDLRRLKRAARQGDVAETRAAGAALYRRAPTAGRREALDALDAAIFGERPTKPDLKAFARRMRGD